MSKISELSDGGVIQGGDTLIAVRSGGNVKVTYGGSTTANIDGGTIDGTVIGGTTAAAITGTTITGTSFVSSGDMTFGDSDKAVFGAGSDLQIYHDGTSNDSIIDEAGTGNLNLQGTNVVIKTSGGSATQAEFFAGDANRFYYNNALKLATTSTGVDVTGTVTADGLTVANTSVIAGDFDGGTAATYIRLQDDTDNFLFGSNNSLGNFLIKNETADAIRLSVANTGDISFYEDTGTTASLVYSAATTSLKLTGRETSRSSDTYVLQVDNSAHVSNMDAAGTFGVKGYYGNSLTVSGLGDVRFYDDSNTAKFFWDASAESLGIGTSTPARPLHISTSGVIPLRLTSTGTDCQIELGNSGGTPIIGSFNDQLIFNTASTERLRITSTGACEWRPDGTTQAMTLDASGNLLVGTTSTIPFTFSSGTGAGITSTGTVMAAATAEAGLFNRTGSDGSVVNFYKAGAIVGSISVTTSTTTYNTSSDQRLKENITDAPAGNIDDIKVRSFDWKADGSHQDYGMVAQELEAVAPYAVTKGETEDDMWSVDYSKLVPMLIKEIQDLKAEVAALKGAN
jgi:hypothetical protein